VDAFRDDIPFKWAGSSSKGQPQHDGCQFLVRELGDCLNGRYCIEVAPSISQLDINLLEHNGLVWEIASSRYYPAQESHEAPTIHASLQLFLDYSLVDQGSGLPLETLLVSQSFLVHDISICVKCELMHDVHWCQARSWDALNLVEWDN
jgi:hypothetical protein